MFRYENNNPKNKVDCAILSAMPEELELFIQEFSNLEFSEINISGFSFKIYDYQNSHVLIAYTGIGMVFAASMFAFIHSHFQPDYFLISGTAGGIKKELRIRDVVVAEKAFEAEIQDVFTLLKNTPFESALNHPIKNKYFPAYYSADPELLSIYDSLDFKNINFYKGTVVSSSAFPAPKELFEKIKRFIPYSIDMETSAFYQIAWLFNARVLAVRGISNILNPDGTDEKIHESDLKGSSLAAATVLLSILNKLILLKNQRKLASSSKLQGEALQLAKEYALQPHPEGGYFSLVYKSSDKVKPLDKDRYNDENRSAGTSIYYLLNKDDYSAWHSLKSDEIWHFYKGSPINIHTIDDNEELRTYLLGDPLKIKGASFQVLIKAGSFFAAENVDKNSYSLVGCTVSPGFEYSDFQLPEKGTLIKKFPQHQEIIERLSHHFISNIEPMKKLEDHVVSN